METSGKIEQERSRYKKEKTSVISSFEDASTKLQATTRFEVFFYTIFFYLFWNDNKKWFF